MTRSARRSGASLVVLSLLLVGAHEAGLRLLDRVGVVEQLLSPVGAESVLALLTALLFLILRLVVVWLVPGLAVLGVLRLLPLRSRYTRRGRSTPSHRHPGRSRSAWCPRRW